MYESWTEHYEIQGQFRKYGNQNVLVIWMAPESRLDPTENNFRPRAHVNDLKEEQFVVV